MTEQQLPPPRPQGGEEGNRASSRGLPPLPEAPAEVQERWRDGVGRWGDAFVAFILLRQIEIRRPDVFEAFEHSYIGAYLSYDAIIDEHLDIMEWRRSLDELRLTWGIPTTALDWNRPALLTHIKEVFDLVEHGNRVYVFAK